MASKNRVVLSANVGKIRYACVHPHKEWLAVVSQTSIFTLWNYREHVVIKSFACSTLGESKNLEVKEIVFYDKHSLPMIPLLPMRSQLLFVCPTKLLLYDYLSDTVNPINEKEIEQKIIRKACVLSEYKICVAFSDGSFKILDCGELYSKNALTIKTVRGYHTRPINWLIAYSQNVNQMPRIITVSGQDGLMACWNLDTLGSNDQMVPSFKFAGRSNEQIISLQYDNTSYRLVTLTNVHITIWSTMTGMELKRVPNTNKYLQIAVFNHFSFGCNSFIAHSGISDLSIILDINTRTRTSLSLRDLIREGDPNILAIKTLPSVPSEILFVTSTHLLVLEVDKFYRPSFGTHPSFTTKLSSLNIREFIIKNEGALRRDISNYQLQTIVFESQLLMNSFFLSVEGGFINFNMVQLQYENMLVEQRRIKFHRLQGSVLREAYSNGGQTWVQVSSDGCDIIVFNREAVYFQVYSCMTEDILSSNTRIDFYSHLKLVANGLARDVIWHQSKPQFAAIQGFSAQDELIAYPTFQKHPVNVLDQIKSWRVCIYCKNGLTYSLILRTDPIKTKIYRVFSLGSFFGYSNQKDNLQCMSLFIQEKDKKGVEGSLLCPQRVYVSYCESYHIYAYDNYFVIYKIHSNGSLSFFRTVYETIIDGLFWEKLFFFVTKTKLMFMQIVGKELVTTTICGAWEKEDKEWRDLGGYGIEGRPHALPDGQLQLVTIINSHLMVLNTQGHVALLSLQQFPYIEFCIHVIVGAAYGVRAQELYQKSGVPLKLLMKQTMNAYGLIVSELIES